MTNGLRIRLIRAFFIIISVYSITAFAILGVHFTVVESYKGVLDNIILEHQLIETVSNLITSYNSYFRHPNAENLETYRNNKAMIESTFLDLDNKNRSEESRVSYDGLKNTIRSVIAETDAGTTLINSENITGASLFYDEANNKYRFALENATTLVMKELDHTRELEEKMQRFYLASSTLLIAILITVIIGAFAYAISFTETVTGPLIKLTNLARDIAKGDIDLNVENNLIKKENEIGVLAESFAIMVTNLRQNIKSLDERNKDLDKLNDELAGMKLKTEFLHIINHQLRTPVSALRGYLELWKDNKFEKFSPERQAEMKKNILIASDQLASIVNSMVDALELESEGKKISLDLSDINLFDLINEIYKTNFAHGFNDKNIQFSLKGDSELLIRSDRKYLESIISNLIDNSLKYTGSGKISALILRENSNAIVKISDTGIGLTEEDKIRLFQKFVRSEEATKMSPGGSGLGLYIVKKMVDLLHGTIAVESAGRGKGTSFIVSLPIKI